MAELQDQPEMMKRAFLQMIRIVASINFPLYLGLLIVADDAVTVTLGTKWLPIAPIVQVLCVFGLIRSLDMLFPPVLYARHRVEYLFWYTLSLLVGMPITFLVGALWWGPLGLAIASIPAYCLLMARMARTVLDELDVSLRELLTQLWPPALASSVMILSVELTLVATNAWLKGGQPLHRLLIFCSVGAVAYCVVLAGTGSPVLGELKEVLGWFVGRRADQESEIRPETLGHPERSVAK
jgi:O-antigen/teichoic acid export membrane protein